MVLLILFIFNCSIVALLLSLARISKLFHSVYLFYVFVTCTKNILWFISFCWRKKTCKERKLRVLFLARNCKYLSTSLLDLSFWLKVEIKCHYQSLFWRKKDEHSKYVRWTDITLVDLYYKSLIPGPWWSWSTFLY